MITRENFIETTHRYITLHQLYTHAVEKGSDAMQCLGRLAPSEGVLPKLKLRRGRRLLPRLETMGKILGIVAAVVLAGASITIMNSQPPPHSGKPSAAPGSDSGGEIFLFPIKKKRWQMINVPPNGACFYHAILGGLEAENLVNKFRKKSGIPIGPFVESLKKKMVCDVSYIKTVRDMFHFFCKEIQKKLPINSQTDFLAQWTKDLFNQYIEHDKPDEYKAPEVKTMEQSLAAVNARIAYDLSIQFGHIAYNQRQRHQACSKVEDFVKTYLTKVLETKSWANEPERTWIFKKLNDCDIHHIIYLENQHPTEKDARHTIYLHNASDHWQYYTWIADK